MQNWGRNDNSKAQVQMWRLVKKVAHRKASAKKYRASSHVFGA